MYTLGTGRILIKSIIIVCLLNLLAWKASWAHRTGENEKKEDNNKIKKKSVQTSSACEWLQAYAVHVRVPRFDPQLGQIIYRIFSYSCFSFSRELIAIIVCLK